MGASKDIGVVIALPAELKHRIDAMAAQVGLSAQTLMLAWVLQGMKGPPERVAAPARVTVEAMQEIERGESKSFRTVEGLMTDLHADDDAWRGPPPDDDPEPPSDVNVDAMVASRVAEAESSGLAQPPGQAYEAFGPPTAQVAPANVRALRRPPPLFAPNNQASHLRSL